LVDGRAGESFGRIDADEQGEAGQLRVGPGRERLAYPQIKFAFGQAPLYERRLEHLDCLLAVGVGGAELATAAAFCGCYLISRP
jgi:hypothetical protein